MKRLFIAVLIILTFVALAAFTRQPQIIDIDGDGFKEARVFRGADRKITKAIIDVDHNGLSDTVVYYKDGYRDRSEQDVNEDGRPDRWVYYYFTGMAWKMAEDSNWDGQADYWIYLKDGQVYRWEQDRNADGKPDVKTTYEVKDGKRVFSQQSLDDDFDGEFELISGITASKREARIPHSLAEALLR